MISLKYCSFFICPMQKGSKPEVNSENFKCYTTFKVVQSEIVRGCPSSPIFNERELLELRQNQ
nr:MAG TPA: hypothetical protein [Caudoviricetes sp.]